MFNPSLKSRRRLIDGFCMFALLGAIAMTSMPHDVLAKGKAKAAMGAQTKRATLKDWPKVTSAIKRDAQMEKKIASMVASMSLRQKIGQMTQPEIKAITPDEVKQYYIGSVLNGGGSWPKMNKHSSVNDWLVLSDAYYKASMTTDMKTPVPIIWGTDAVHGHSNIYGATLFPHNIGLGAAHNPKLVYNMGQATAKAVRATGINWAFAPTLAVVKNQRWGRSYEGFSSDPMVVRAYSSEYVRGLQGDLKGSSKVVATAKHFIGDGGTDNGVNEGMNTSSFSFLINDQAQGYYGALAAGAQTVMATYNSWTDTTSGKNHGKVHGAPDLLQTGLKDKMSFDGFVISDWDAIKQVEGCTVSQCPRAINAGVDMIMVPFDWKAFIENTIKDVETGKIPMSRIDDAVTRILRVKIRSGLFDNSPSQDVNAGLQAATQDRANARDAVRQSLVLLKNNKNILPLKPNQNILVVGKSADSISNQVGGWSLTWQGTENTNADFPNADSLLTGIKGAAGNGKVTYSETGLGVDVSSFDVVIAVIGETPYAETKGDIKPQDSMAHSLRHPEDLAVLKAVSGTKTPVVTVFLSGRTTYANDIINLSDSFVAAWLPGSEGRGVADVLFTDAKGRVAYDFKGRLSFAWPDTACPMPQSKPLFPLMYGLTYSSKRASMKPLSVNIMSQGCPNELATSR